MQTPLIVGNWKLNGNKKIINHFFTALLDQLKHVESYNVVIAPPFPYLDYIKNILSKNNCKIKLGAQNVDINLYGSFTGAISGNMLKDIGVQYVIIGHSECRKLYQESNELIAKKFFLLKNIGLIPILCIGENQHEKNKALDVCIKQLESIIQLQGIQLLKNTIIAYEPIWAIGSGIAAKHQDVQKIHHDIRCYLQEKSLEISNDIIILYGGSIDNNNCSEFLAETDINGLLVGSASLNADIFFKIINNNI